MFVFKTTKLVQHMHVKGWWGMSVSRLSLDGYPGTADILCLTVIYWNCYVGINFPHTWNVLFLSANVLAIAFFSILIRKFCDGLWLCNVNILAFSTTFSYSKLSAFFFSIFDRWLRWIIQGIDSCSGGKAVYLPLLSNWIATLTDNSKMVDLNHNFIIIIIWIIILVLTYLS